MKNIQPLSTALALLASVAMSHPVLAAPKACAPQAVENVEAVSRLMYAPKGLSRAKTRVLRTEKRDDTTSFIEVETYDASEEPLHCIYRAEMMSNDTGDCWLVGLTQTECSQ